MALFSKQLLRSQEDEVAIEADPPPAQVFRAAGIPAPGNFSLAAHDEEYRQMQERYDALGARSGQHGMTGQSGDRVRRSSTGSPRIGLRAKPAGPYRACGSEVLLIDRPPYHARHSFRHRAQPEAADLEESFR